MDGPTPAGRTSLVEELLIAVDPVTAVEAKVWAATAVVRVAEEELVTAAEARVWAVTAAV